MSINVRTRRPHLTSAPNVRARRPHPTSAPDVLIRPWLKSLAGVVGLLLSGLLFSCSDELSDAHAPALYVEDAGPSVATADTTTYSPDSSNNEPAAEIEEFRATESSLLWVNSPDWNFSASFANSPTYSSGSKYSLAVGRFIAGEDVCSGFLINSFDFATARHCLDTVTIGTTISPIFGTLTSVNTSLPALRQRLVRLGVEAAYLEDAVEVLKQTWTCGYLYRPGSRDIVVFMCDPKTIDMSPTVQRTLYPGDVWGHIDLTTDLPPEGDDIYLLSINQRTLADQQRILLSPSGEVVTGNDACESASYTSCVAQQGADALGGSSGGVALVRDTNLAYGVIHGYRTCLTGGDLRNPRDQNWWCNRNLNTRIASGMEVIPGITGTLPPPSSSSYSTLSGGTGGTLTDQNCLGREALVGLVLSEYDDNYNSGAASIGLIAGVCSVVQPAVLRWDQLFVQSPGSYDTNFATTPSASSADRVRLNRFVNTIDSSGEAPLTGPVVEDLTWEICPSGYAIASLSGRVKYGKVMRLDQAICRHTTNMTIPDYVSQIEVGATETGSTVFATSCPSGNYANGLRVRVGWFLDAVSLRCRPR